MASRRAKNFKMSSSTVDKMRKRREAESVELRKSKRDEEYMKRRKLTVRPGCSGDGDDSGGDGQHEAMDEASGFPVLHGRAAAVALPVDSLTNDITQQLAAARLSYSSRTADGKNRGPQFEPMTNLSRQGGDILQLALQQLKSGKASVELMGEFMWIVRNSARSSPDMAVAAIDAGCAAVLVDLLTVEWDTLGMHLLIIDSLDTLIHILHSTAKLFSSRDVPVLTASLPAVLARTIVCYTGLLTSQPPSSHPSECLGVLHAASMLVTCLCKEVAVCKVTMVTPLLPVMLQLIHHGNAEVSSLAGVAVETLSSSTCTNELLRCGAATSLVHRLGYGCVRDVIHALRALGNLLCGSEDQVEVIVDAGILPKVHTFIRTSQRSFCQHGLRAIANVAAGNSRHVQAIIDEKMLPRVAQLLGKSDLSVRKEALWLIGNAMHSASREQQKYLLRLNCHASLGDMLTVESPDVVCFTLDTLARFLRLDKATQPLRDKHSFAQAFLECGGVDKLWAVVHSENHTISQLADYLLSKYFSDGEEEEEDYEDDDGGGGGNVGDDRVDTAGEVAMV